MTTEAAIGHGVRFQRSSGTSPVAWTDIGELLEPAGPKLARDTVDATHSQSVDRFREFISGLRDAGEATALLALVPGAGVSDAYKKLVDDYMSNAPKTYRILFPNDAETQWEFAAFITGLDNAIPIDDRMTVSTTFKITGKPILSDGA